MGIVEEVQANVYEKILKWYYNEKIGNSMYSYGCERKCSFHFRRNKILCICSITIDYDDARALISISSTDMKIIKRDLTISPDTLVIGGESSFDIIKGIVDENEGDLNKAINLYTFLKDIDDFLDGLS